MLESNQRCSSSRGVTARFRATRYDPLQIGTSPRSRTWKTLFLRQVCMPIPSARQKPSRNRQRAVPPSTAPLHHSQNLGGPGRIRTFTAPLLRRPPLPVGLQGRTLWAGRRTREKRGLYQAPPLSLLCLPHSQAARRGLSPVFRPRTSSKKLGRPRGRRTPNLPGKNRVLCRLSYRPTNKVGGPGGSCTRDLLLARQALC